MLKTLKKMILHTKDDPDLDKPSMNRDDRDYSSRDDYHIPEPQDIRRLSAPEFQETPRPYSGGMDYGREPPRNDNYSMPERPPMRPPPLPEARPQPRSGIENDVRDILYRLDNIERRLARLEGTYAPQPRRY